MLIELTKEELEQVVKKGLDGWEFMIRVSQSESVDVKYITVTNERFTFSITPRREEKAPDESA